MLCFKCAGYYRHQSSKQVLLPSVLQTGTIAISVPDRCCTFQSLTQLVVSTRYRYWWIMIVCTLIWSLDNITKRVQDFTLHITKCTSNNTHTLLLIKKYITTPAYCLKFFYIFVFVHKKSNPINMEHCTCIRYNSQGR